MYPNILDWAAAAGEINDSAFRFARTRGKSAFIITSPSVFLSCDTPKGWRSHMYTSGTVLYWFGARAKKRGGLIFRFEIAEPFRKYGASLAEAEDPSEFSKDFSQVFNDVVGLTWTDFCERHRAIPTAPRSNVDLQGLIPDYGTW